MFDIPPLYFWIYIASVSFIFLLCHFIFGKKLKFYDKTKYFDLIMHFTSSGFLFAVLGFWVSHKYLNQPIWFSVLFAFLISVAINALWEIYEFTIDSIFGTNMQRWKDKRDTIRDPGIIDIMTDLIACTLGALFVCIILIVLFIFFK